MTCGQAVANAGVWVSIVQAGALTNIINGLREYPFNPFGGIAPLPCEFAGRSDESDPHRAG